MYTLLADPPALRRPLWLILHKPRRPAGAGGFYRHLYTSYTNPGGIPQGARRYFDTHLFLHAIWRFILFNT